MKRLFLITVLTLSLFGNSTAQLGRGSEWICTPSEIEIWDEGFINSAEFYLRKLVDTCGVDEFYHVLDLVEEGRIGAYIQLLIDKGNAFSKQYIDAVRDIQWVDAHKTCFVYDSIFYVMTYMPVKGTPTTKKVYLFGRNHLGWFQASNEIREDYYIYEVASKQFKINNENYPGSRYWINDTIMALVNETVERDKDFNATVYNTITVLIPHSNKTFAIAYLEPLKKIKFDVNQIQSKSTPNGLKIKYESQIVEFKIVGNDLVFESNKFARIR